MTTDFFSTTLEPIPTKSADPANKHDEQVLIYGVLFGFMFIIVMYSFLRYYNCNNSATSSSTEQYGSSSATQPMIEDVAEHGQSSSLSR